MGFLDNSTVTVDAILTKRGRQILSQGGNFNITKFALSDEEIDYTLYDVTHPNGTNSYGTVIENMSILEAAPNRTTFNSFLVNSSLAGVKVAVDTLTYSNVEPGAIVSISPSTIGGAEEQYVFSIGNTNIVRFNNGGTGKTLTAKSAELKAQNLSVAATTTITVQGLNSGVTNVITVNVKADPASSNDPTGPENVVEDPRDERLNGGLDNFNGGGGEY